MRTHRRDPWPAAPEFQLLASFGAAQTVKDLSNRLHLRGGTPEDRAEAHAWAAQFLSGTLHETRPLRYTIMPRPERPAPTPRPLPPPRPELTLEERLRQYLANNPPLRASPPCQDPQAKLDRHPLPCGSSFCIAFCAIPCASFRILRHG
jgi:hypothetical protein